MTLRDKVRMESPNNIDRDVNGGVFGCPVDYDFLRCSDCAANCDGESAENCKKCWDREFIPPAGERSTTYKHDDGKLRIDLVTPNIIEQIAKVRTFGVSKYGDNDGWKKVGIKRYEAALLRHLNEYRKGNLIDEESGLPHLAHVACNLMFIMDLESEG